MSAPRRASRAASPIAEASPAEASPAEPRPRLGLRIEGRAPLSVLVSRQLRQAIMAGRVGTGVEMPSEKELGQELGVGRSTVREALRILQAQGLLSGGDTVSTKRPRVSSEQTLSLAAAQAMENAVRLAQVPLDDLVELRVVLEGAAVAAAAADAAPLAQAAPTAKSKARATKARDAKARNGNVRGEKAPTLRGVDSEASDRREAALASAANALAAMTTSGLDIEAFRAADLAFHRSLAAASGNAAFPLVMGVLRGAIANHLGEALHHEVHAGDTMARLAKEHAAIFDAVVAHDGARARALVTDHIRDFYRSRPRTP